MSSGDTNKMPAKPVDKNQLLEEKCRELEKTSKQLYEKIRLLRERDAELTSAMRREREKEEELKHVTSELELCRRQMELLREELQEKKSRLQLLEEKNKDVLQTEMGDEPPEGNILQHCKLKKKNSCGHRIDFQNNSAIHSQASHFIASELRIVLLGATADCKAKVAGVILGKEEFSPSSQQGERRQGEVAGRRLTLVNTPSWSCSGLPREEVRQAAERCVQLSTPGPHAFLLVIPLDSSGVNRGMEEQIEEVFGEVCWKHTLILFTSAEGQAEGKLSNLVQSGVTELQDLLKKCSNRYHLLDVVGQADSNQVMELLEKIEDMVESNTEKYYSSETYLMIEEQLKEMERRIEKERAERKEREEQEIREKIEKELQESLTEMKEQIQEKEEKIVVLETKIVYLEKELEEEKNDERKRELERQLREEAEKREETEREKERLKEDMERQKKEKEEKHRRELEELSESYEREARAEAEKNLMKIILPELQRNVYIHTTKMRNEFIRQAEEKDREIERQDQMLKEKNREIEEMRQEVLARDERLRDLEEKKERGVRAEGLFWGFTGWIYRHSSGWFIHNLLTST